jgi:Na+/pantothenate symporter
MNAAYIHLSLNHFPLVLNLAAIAVLFAGAMRKSIPVTRTALVLLICSVALAVPVYYTGEGAEEIVEEMQGINERAIHPHEEAGEFTLIAYIAQGLAALVALFFVQRRWLTVIVLLLSLVATGAVIRTAYLGGKIHHPEAEMKA